MPLTKVKSGGVSDSITLTSPDINAPDIDGGTIDNAVIGGSTAAAGSFTTITATGGSSSNWNTAYGWGDHSTQSYATQTYVGTEVSNLVDSSPAALDTLNELAAALGDDPNFATTVTNSIALKAPLASPSFTGTATMDGLTVDNITIDGSEIDCSSGNLVLDSASNITLDADGGQFEFKDGGTLVGQFDYTSGSNFEIQNRRADGDITFRGFDSTSFITALTLDMSAAGAATFNSTIASAGVTSSNSITMTAGNMSLNSTSDGNQAFRYYRADGTLVVQQYPYNNRFNVQTYNNQGLRLKSDGSGQIELEGNVVINEDSADVDFRVESSGNANMLFVDGGNNRVGVGLSNPQQSFSVQMANAGRVGSFYDTGTNGNSMYNGAAVLGVSRSSNGSTSLNGPIFEVGRDNGLNATYNVSDSFLTVRNDSTVINEDSQDHDFRVESDTQEKAIFVDASNDEVRILGNKFLEPVSAYFISSGTLNRNITVGLNGCGEYYIIMHIVGIWPYSGSNPGTRIIEVAGFGSSNVINVIRNTHYGSGPTGAVTVSATGGNLVVSIVTGQNYRWSAHCEVVAGGGGMHMSVDGNNG